MLSSFINTHSWISADLAEILSIMIEKEQTLYKSSDYLNPRPSSQQLQQCISIVKSVDAASISPNTSSTHAVATTCDAAVTLTDRTKLVDWCYTVVDTYKFRRETVAITMEMVDRFLSKKPRSASTDTILNNVHQFQLLTMTALYTAIKVHETPAILGSDVVSAISQCAYSVDEIEAMELTLLLELSWRVSPPTCVQMAHHILSMVAVQVTDIDQSTWNCILDEMNYQVEHAVRDYYFVTQRPSTVAIAAIINSISTTTMDEQKRHAILSALSTVIMNDDLEPIDIILGVKRRLISLVYARDGETTEGD